MGIGGAMAFTYLIFHSILMSFDYDYDERDVLKQILII